MVYLESIRFNTKGSQRSVVSGQRVPIELTALGRAWLAVAPQSERQSFMEQLKAKRRNRWRLLQKEIIEAATSIKRRGYCVATWQPQVIALSSPLVAVQHPIHVVNVSVTTGEPRASVIAALEQPLLAIAEELRRAMNDAG
jgi:DNA-binding IclR family transcriptional regulator